MAEQPTSEDERCAGGLEKRQDGRDSWEKHRADLMVSEGGEEAMSGRP